MEYTAQQEEGIELARQLLKEPAGSVGVVSGYAGTGKTTLIKGICAEVNRVTLAAPTGRAALRLREATHHPATTLHRWLYNPHENRKTGEVTFTRKAPGDVDARSLVVVDEASMVSREVWTHLQECARYHAKGAVLLLVGDEAQLPPVERQSNCGLEPFSVFSADFAKTFSIVGSVRLTEVMRQAAESPIVSMATGIRTTSSFREATNILRHYYPRPTRDRDRLVSAVVGGTGALICHTNRTRSARNAALRPDPTAECLFQGEPLLVRRNNYSLMRFNGELLPGDAWDPRFFTDRRVLLSRENLVFSEVAVRHGESDELVDVLIYVPSVIGEHNGQAPLPAIETRLVEYGEILHRDEYLHANLGYCITAHSAQGSEWPQVRVVLEPSLFGMPPGDAIRWLYTAVTRAKETFEWEPEW